MNYQRQMKELRTTARDLGVEPVGDRRKRETWEQAIERQAQIMDIPLEAAYNPIFRTTLFGSRDRLSFKVIELALELIQRHCYSTIRRKWPLIVVSLLAFELASKALPGISLENIPGVEIEALVLPEESSDTLAVSSGVDRVQEPIAQAVETFPGVELEPVQEPIAQAAETSPGVSFSAAFLTWYSPPQSENIFYKPDVDGQLSLLDFEVVVIDEPPDPDDFESLDAFREAIALWDLQQPIDVSLDSFTYWAPCPDDWYEPAGENSPGFDHVQALERKNISGFDHVQELLKSSITSEFFILVFGCDRPDEPPTAGVGARLPKPKPPSFPSAYTKRISNAYQMHSCFAGVTAGYSGRSPPGGDVTI